MKTINVSDAMYDQLVALGREIAGQDNRCTARPYLFQIQTDVKVWDTGLNGSHLVVMSEDWDEVGEFNKSTIQALAHRWEMEYPEWIDDFDLGIVSAYDAEEWLKQRGYRITSYSITHKYENGFLTEKACQAHINGNRHHYDNPVDYLSYAFRNPELDLIYRFLESLTVKAEDLPF